MPRPRSSRRLTEILGSLRLAIVLLATLGLICAAATFYESRQGTPAVQRDVYQTAWFTGLLVALGVNVAVSLAGRFPWKVHQSGFVMAHVGVLLILLGSLVSLHFGLDASLPLYEGETARQLEMPAPAAAAEELPFTVTLLEFRSDKYPGSHMAATYESLVRIHDDAAGDFERRISMNRPLHHRGYVFFQASYVEGTPMMSILSVARAPGLPVVYLGTALLCAGVVWMFYVNPALARRRAALALRQKEETHETTGRAARPAAPAVVAAGR
jgi:cytochrome c biogenesis protein ResB